MRRQSLLTLMMMLGSPWHTDGFEHDGLLGFNASWTQDDFIVAPCGVRQMVFQGCAGVGSCEAATRRRSIVDVHYIEARQATSCRR